MAKIRIVDKEDKFLVEIDGMKIPYTTSYVLERSVNRTVLLKLALAVSDAEVEIETDKPQIKQM